jgi:putative two-component system response regulator
MAKRRILIVDDEPDFTRPIKDYLERSGLYEVREEHRGVRAFYTAQAFRPDLVLLDVMMMDLDGSEVADQLRADEGLSKIPIVFVTGVITKEEANERGGRIGGHPFLAKPVSLREVQETVERHLSKLP